MDNDFRVNAYFQRGHMAAALRSIPSEIPKPHEVNISDDIIWSATNLTVLILVVGPTGSGKSTTLACMLDRINRQRACRIITVEDPIKFTHEGMRSTLIEEKYMLIPRVLLRL